MKREGTLDRRANRSCTAGPALGEGCSLLDGLARVPLELRVPVRPLLPDPRGPPVRRVPRRVARRPGQVGPCSQRQIGHREVRAAESAAPTEHYYISIPQSRLLVPAAAAVTLSCRGNGCSVSTSMSRIPTSRTDAMPSISATVTITATTAPPLRRLIRQSVISGSRDTVDTCQLVSELLSHDFSVVMPLHVDEEHVA